MDRLLEMLLSRWAAPEALDPLQKFSAARRLVESGASGRQWLAALVLLAALGGAVLLLIAAIYNRWAAARRARRLFSQQLEQAGLTGPERAVMLAVAQAGQRRDPTAALTSAAVFERGSAALLTSRKVTALSEAKQQEVAGLVASLRRKLGLENPGAGDPGEPQPSLRPGSRLTVVYRGQPATFDVEVQDVSAGELLVRPMSPMTCRAGESWLIRHAEGGRLWEFDAPVLRTGAEHISLGRTSRPRFVNRRRFPRVPTVRPAHVAGFPLWRAAADEAAPRFVEGRLVEMGGPGLRVEAPLEARPGQRVLLAMEMGDGGFVEGVGKVHRVSHPDAASDPVFVVELVGLTEDEIASLSKQTNAMERSAISDQQSAVSDQAAPDSQEQAPKSQELTAES